jgi:hypothetical protein
MAALVVRGVGGAAMMRETCWHPRVQEHICRLASHLQWHGPLFADYFIDEQAGTPEYIEVNPRIGDPGNATLSGVDICEKWIDIGLGRAEPLTYHGEIGFRSHAAMLMLISRAQETGSRRAIVREICEQFRGTGRYTNSVEEMTRPKQDRWSLAPYMWVAGQLVLNPAKAGRIVRGTVERYALSHDAAEHISKLPIEQLEACLDA